jgi:type IX secretion system PorP/SprF family membrane protein
MRLKLFIAIIITTSINYQTVSAQQIFKISQFVQHNYINNPAATGANTQASVGAAYRKMWAGMPGGPQTTILYGDKYFDSKNTGVGAVLYSDITGPTSRTGGQVNLSYSIEMKEGRRLMFGLSGMFMQYRIDRASFARYIPNDPLLAGDGTEMKGDAAAGVYYRSNKLNIGFSVQQLLQSKLNFIKTATNTQGKLYRHYFVGGHYNWRTDEDNVLVPNASLMFVENFPAEFEAGVRLEHKDFLYAGLNFHYKQSISAFVGFKAKKRLSIGYAYEQYNSPVSVFQDGSAAHEISMRYFFAK